MMENGAPPPKLPVSIHTYIKENVQQADCKPHPFHVCTDRPEENLCKCGRERSWPSHESIPDLDEKATFDLKKYLEKHNTTDYGEICFQGFGFGETINKPYIRVHQDTEPRHLWNIIRDYWRVRPPKLIISVTGGAKFFTMKPRLIQAFKRGLINAATTTDAWIITGGTNAGVMEFVGEAVREHILIAGASSSKVVALGIATWGIIDNKDPLMKSADKHGRYPAYYRNANLSPKEKRLSPLDPNHSHFILVDDGTERHFGVEIQLRAKLERHVSQTIKMDTSIPVPVVTLVLEGGENTIETAAKAVENKTPIVIIQGSCRAADVLAEAYWGTRGPDDVSVFYDEFDDSTRSNIKEKMAITAKESCEKVLRNIKNLLKDRNMITVFHMGDEEGHSRDMDKAILYSLLRANREVPPTQLRLALAWDCSDMAKTELFKIENRQIWKNTTVLYDPMSTALIQNRSKFVQLFLDNGVDLSSFLTPRRLEELYNEVLNYPYAGASERLLKDLLTEQPRQAACYGNSSGTEESPTLHHISNIVDGLMGGVSKNLYTDALMDVDDLNKSQDKGQPFRHPERELFIWATLLNRRELAQLFWRNGKDHIGGALSASYILKALVHEADKREELDLKSSSR